MAPREYLFTVEERGNHMQVEFLVMSKEIAPIDLILIAMRVLKAVAEIHPPPPANVAAALKALKFDEIYDSGALN